MHCAQKTTFKKCDRSGTPVLRAYLVVVGQLVALEFALVRSHQQIEVVSFEKVFGDVGPEVGSGAAQSVRAAAVGGLRIAPQHVKHLHRPKIIQK
jgi:hypothetical protein